MIQLSRESLLRFLEEHPVIRAAEEKHYRSYVVFGLNRLKGDSLEETKTFLLFESEVALNSKMADFEFSYTSEENKMTKEEMDSVVLESMYWASGLSAMEMMHVKETTEGVRDSIDKITELRVKYRLEQEDDIIRFVVMAVTFDEDMETPHLTCFEYEDDVFKAMVGA